MDGSGINKSDHASEPAADSGSGLFGSQAQTDQPHCLVVMYHYVGESGAQASRTPVLGGKNTRTPSAPGVRGLTEAAFCNQLDQLSDAAEPIDWPTLYAWLDGRGSIPKRSFLLSFDDGLADHRECVLPILDKRGLRGLFFVPGTVLKEQRMLPAHAIHLLLSTLDDETLVRELRVFLSAQAGLDVNRIMAIDRSAAERMYHYEPPPRAHLKYLLTVGLNVDLRTAVIDALFERFVGSSARWARRWYLGWDEVTEIEAGGHTIGAHGFSHEPYGGLTAAERRADMHNAAAILRGGLGPGIRPFSYPYGQFDDDTRVACREAGFPHAFTTHPAWVNIAGDALSIPRFDTINVDAALMEAVACHSA